MNSFPGVAAMLSANRKTGNLFVWTKIRKLLRSRSDRPRHKILKNSLGVDSERPADAEISPSEPKIANSTLDKRPTQTRAWTLASDGVFWVFWHLYHPG